MSTDIVAARNLVEGYMSLEGTISTTQEILDSNTIPRLAGYHVRPGKVSDSIYGGPVKYTKKSGEIVECENPPLTTRDGIPLRIMVRTDRISTHDINRGTIPFKDQILAVNHMYLRNLLAQVLGTSQFDVQGLGETSVVIAAENLTSIPVEMVLRGYMAKSTTATSLYQHFMSGERIFCGHKLPDDLIPNGPLPYVMDTPSTKSETHDESLRPVELFERGLCTPSQYYKMRADGLMAFGIGTHILRERGLILVDTKTEHGITRDGRLVSQDELYTLDSSRFWLAEDYEDQMRKLISGEIQELNPKSFSKEFARGFSQGEQGYTDEQRIQIAVRYIEGIEHLLQRKFQPNLSPRNERVIEGLKTIVENLAA